MTGTLLPPPSYEVDTEGGEVRLMRFMLDDKVSSAEWCAPLSAESERN